MITRDDLFRELALNTERVAFAGGEIIVTELTATEYMALWNDPIVRVDGTVDQYLFPVALVARCVVDEAGSRLFSDADISRLRQSSREPLLKLIEAAKRLNGLGEDALKNSAETAPEGSRSVSASS